MKQAYDILVKLIVLYLYSIVFYNLIPIPLTQIIGAIMLFLLIVIHARNLIKVNAVLLFYVGFVAVYTTIVTSNYSENFSDFVRVALLLLFVNLCAQKKHSEFLNEALESNKQILLFSSCFTSVITLIELFLPYCYYVESSWGTSAYFRGFAPTLHVTASCMCLIMCMYLVAIKGKRFKVSEMFYLFPPLFAIFQSGARIYLLCSFGILLCYYFSRIKGKSIKFVLVPVAILGIGYLLFSSNIMDKFLFASTGYAPDTYTVMDKFTSGRTYFWLKDINAYNESPVIMKVFGNGFYYIYEVSNLSGHNDILHMLLGIGVVGVIFYLNVFVRAIKTTFALSVENDVQKSVRILNILAICLFVFSPMLLNGIFGYPHLVISMVLLMTFCCGYDSVFSNNHIS